MEYIELHCHSNYSLLDGAAHPEALVERAAELGMSALALTDHDALYGAVRFAQAAQNQGIKPIFGAELTLSDDHHLTVLVENKAGWHNLCWLISQARHNAPKGQAALPPTALVDRTEGLLALSGCKQSEIVAALRRKDNQAAVQAACRYRDLFGPDHFWIELQHHLLPEDDTLVADLVELADFLGLGYVATNNVHYALRAGCQLQDVLVCIRHNTRLDEAGPLLRPNSEYYLKSVSQLRPLFADYPAALTNTLRIAERCHFTLQYGLQDLPQFPTPAGLDAAGYLRQLCQASLTQRYPDRPNCIIDQLDHELTLIEQVSLSNYFLIVWDIVRYAREQRILCQGRGSAANSLVAYLLNISPIDPLEHHLVFERFLSPERAIAPDIDLDFQADRREEVIQYVYRRYDVEHAAMAYTAVTFQKRSALRAVGKALGISNPLLARAAEKLSELETVLEPTDKPESSLDLLVNLCRQIDGFPRHLGIHNGGMVITGPPLSTRVPTEPATMPERVVVQWDKEALEGVGLVKIDLLGLRMLSAIAEAVKLISESFCVTPDLPKLSFTDPEVYRMIAAADTIGVFQVESRAQAQMLPYLKPSCFNDLIVAVSLIRPGPIQGDMVHPYLRRRRGIEPVTYLHPLLEPALAETLGVILYQEQVLRVVHDFAGFSLGQGEQLRRALGSKRGAAEIEKLHQSFLMGAQAKGVSAEVAETVFDRLRAFGSYAFAKSHAASFAVIVYWSAWLKRYYLAAYTAALLNHQPMGFWTPAVLLGDAKRHGIAINPVDINRSRSRCTLEGEGIRLGFCYVDGFGEMSIARVEAAQQEGAFTGLADFCRRTRLARRLVENLIMAGAMDSWGRPRRQLLWELGQLSYQPEEFALVFPSEEVNLPPLSPAEALLSEYKLLGLSTGEHIMTLYRPWLAERGILGSWELKAQPQGRQVRVAGLLVVHQAPPTAKNFHFLTLEDEAGLVDVILRPPIYTRFRRVILTDVLLIVEGVIQQEGGVVNLLAEYVAVIPKIATL